MTGTRRDTPDLEKKRATTVVVLRELLVPIPDDQRGLRNRALLLNAFRRRTGGLNWPGSRAPSNTIHIAATS